MSCHIIRSLPEELVKLIFSAKDRYSRSVLELKDRVRMATLFPC